MRLHSSCSVADGLSLSVTVMVMEEWGAERSDGMVWYGTICELDEVGLRLRHIYHTGF